MEHIKEKKNTLIISTILALSVASFVDVTYLAMKRLVGSPVVCDAFNNGCGVVDASSYSAIWGVPLAMLGWIFYGIILLLLVQFLLRRQKMVLNIAAAMLLFGGVFSIYLIVLQAFVIKAWCFYCLISDTIGIVNALLIIYLFKKKK